MTSSDLLSKVLDFQDHLIRRGALDRPHEVLDGTYCTDGRVLIECTCGRGHLSADEPSSLRDYALHVASELGLQVRAA